MFAKSKPQSIPDRLHPSSPVRRLSGDRWLLGFLWLFQAISSLIWLWQDSRFPVGQAADHLTRAVRVADVLAHPSLDGLSRLAAASSGQPPLYYVLTAPLIWIFGSAADAAIFANLGFLALLLACTYGIARLLPWLAGQDVPRSTTARNWPGLAAATALSFFPLVFTYTRQYDPALAAAALASLAVWLLLRSGRLSQRRYAVAFGLTAAAGLLTSSLFWAGVLGPALFSAALALRAPRPQLPVRRKPSRNFAEWLARRIRLAPSHWNLLLALILPALALPWYAIYPPQALGAAGAGRGILWYLSLLDDVLGGFFLLLLIAGLLDALWRLIKPGDRLSAGWMIAWFGAGILSLALAANGAASQLLLVLPAAAILCTTWLVHLAVARQTPQERSRQPALRALARLTLALAAIVALVNFLVISWGAPAGLASALRVQPSAELAPFQGEANAPLLAPGRALYHQYPPARGDWTAAALVQAIDQDCLQPAGCQVVVLSCAPEFEPRSFDYAVAQAGLADQLRVAPLAADPDFYRALLDADYLVGMTDNAATGQGSAQQTTDVQGCTDQVTDEAASAVRANLATLSAAMASAPQFASRFQPFTSAPLLANDATGWVLRRTGRPIDDLDEVERITLLEHMLEVAPGGNRARQELSSLLDQIGDPARAISLREEAVARTPDSVEARLALADLYQANGRAAEALEQYQAAADLDDTRRDTLLKLAQANIDLGQWAAAEQALTRAAELAPNDYETRLLQGQFYIRRNRFADATAALLVARRLDEDRPDAYLALAEAHLLRDDLQRAEELFRQARDVAPGSARPLLAWADALMARQQYDQALELYAQASEVEPDTIEVYAAWIDALQTAGRSDTARSMAETLLQTFPDSPKALKAVAQLYQELDQTDQAIAQYQAAVAVAPQDVEARLALGALLAQGGRLDEAGALYEDGLALPGGQVALLSALGDLDVIRGNYGSAIKSYQQALAIDPAYWQAAYPLGRVYLLQERPNMALQVANAIAQRSQDQYQIPLLQGDAYMALGRTADALAAYRQAISLAPAIAFLYSREGDALLRAGNYSAAQASFEQALRLDARHVDAYTGLGRMHLELALQGEVDAAGIPQDQTRFSQAQDAFRSALLFAADSIPARIGTGDLLVAYGRPEEAIPVYQEVLSLDPSQETARSKLFDLYLAAGRSDEVIPFYQALLEDNPDQADAVIALAEAYLATDQPDAAAAAFQNFLRNHPDDVKTLLAQAQMFLAAGRSDEALVALQQASRLDPIRGNIKRGEALAAQAGLAEAEVAYRAAIEAIESSDVGPAGDSYLAYTGLARVLLRQGRGDEALEVAQAILDLRPDAYPVHILIGDLYRARGQRTQTLAAYQQAVRLAPATPLANSRLGDALLESGQLVEAQTAYEAALAADARYVDGLVGLAKVLNRSAQAQPESAQTQWQQALTLLQRALELNSQSVAAYLTLGDVHRALGQPVEAAQAYQTVLSLEPDHPTALQSLGQTLLAAGNVEEAVASYQAAVAVAPDAEARARRLLTLAAALRGLKRYDEAEQVYQEILQADPANTTARTTLGDLYAQLERLPEAIDQYGQAVRSNPDDLQAAAQLGKAYLRVGQISQAATIAQELVQRHPDAAQSHILAARVADAQGNASAALAKYEQAAALASDNPAVQVELAEALQAAGRLAEAAAAYDAALAADQRSVNALVGLARLNTRQGADDQAEALLRQALEIDSESLAVQAALGRSLLNQGRAGEAIPLLEAARAQQPEHPTALPDLADAYLAVGRLDEGLALYRQMLGSSGDATLTTARALLRAGQVEPALQLYQRYVVEYPADAQARTALANAYRQDGRTELALQAYAEASQIDPNLPDPLLQQADLLSELERWPEAVDAYTAAVDLLRQTPALITEVESAWWQAWSGLARAYNRMGQPESALPLVQEIEALRPDLYQLPLLAGDLYESLDRHEEALAAYDRAANLAPQQALPQTRRGEILLNLERIAEAESAFQASLALDANDATALEGLGRVYSAWGAGASPADFYRAELRLQQAIALAPQNASAYIALGDLYTAYGAPDEAIAHYQSALQAKPDHPTARGKLAKAFLAAGQPEAALAEQLRRQQEAPDDPSVAIALAEIYRILGRFDDAEASYRQAIQLQPENMALLVALGDLYMERAAPDLAASLYQQAAEGARSAQDTQVLVQAQVQLGKAYVRLGRTDEAFALAQDLAANQPGYYQGYLLLGQLYESQNDLPAAQSAFESGLAQAPDSAALRLQLGELYLAMDQPAQAEALFSRLIEDSPAEVAAYVGLARAYMAQAGDLQTLRFERANEALQTALRLDRNSTPAQIALGDLLLARERPAQAVQAYETALRNRTSSADDTAIRLKLAAAYTANDQIDLALQEYQRIAVVNPGAVGIQMALASAYHESGRPILALDQYRAVNGVDSSFPFAYIKQGEILDELERSEEALRAYQAAVRAAPANADAHFTLASAYRARDMIDEAIRELEAGLAIDPERSAARNALERLKIGGL